MVIDVGIDAIDFYVPPFAIDLKVLAEQRNIDPNKYTIGLGQDQMAVLPPDEDIVSMAANAAASVIPQSDKEKIHLLLFATESGVDQSKSAGLWVHHLLDLPSSCRIVEMKQACYSATCALQLAASYLKDHQDEKVLLIASDNARYGLQTPGEPTQGCGAVAMILSTNPRLFILESEQGIAAGHKMDFWRPNYLSEALVDGKYSAKVYLQTLMQCWKEYTDRSKRTFDDHQRFCYHIPFTKMAEKAHERLLRIASPEKSTDSFQEKVIFSLEYARKMGNAYTAALYIGLLSMLTHDPSNLEGQRIGLFSYGSGSIGEFFSGIVSPHYRQHLPKNPSFLENRTILSYKEYEEYFSCHLPTDGSTHHTPVLTPSRYRLSGIDRHIRLYEEQRA